jgi:hypothetical protein
MSNNIQIVELTAYNPPKAVETRQDDWVKFGVKNNYYQFLIDRYNNSTTNNQVINNIVKLIYGKGLDAKDAAKKPSEYAQMKMLFSKEVTKRAITDLKLLGQCALQVIYAKNKKTIVEVQHIPVHLLRPQKCNKEGIIENYYYSDNWDNLRDFPPQLIPSFGNGNRTLEILMIGNYTIGQKYFSNVDYLGGLAYCKLEEDVAEYLISLVESGFSPLTVVNFNNGVPTEDQQKTISDSVKTQAAGPSGNKIIVAFNSDETKKTTIDSIPLNRAADQYEYLSEEARGKILLSHGVTSGLLFGIPSANGFSSNADELKTASVLFQNNVIIPFQETFCDGIDKILAYNGFSLDLYFKPLNSLVDRYEIAQANANEIKMSSHIDEINLDEFGEEIDLDEWELIDSRKVDYNEEEKLDAELNALNNPKKSLFAKVFNLASVSTGVAKTKSASSEDNPQFITRYRYAGNPNPEREFCKKMMSANKLYRKEDIQAMSRMSVNPGFGMSPNSDAPYDIFLWKGGGLLSDNFPNGTCKHYWVREMYRKIGTGKNTAATQATPAEVRKAGYIAPTNDKRGYIAPHDMR